MAQNVQQRIVPQVATPQHYTPPTARELRAQAVQRLQVGVFGLAAMLLMVGLANIVMDRARLSEDENAVAIPLPATDAPANGATDPLADIGVAPAADPSGQAAAKAAQ